MNTGSHKMESQLTGMWVSFFTTAGIPSDVAATYALTFTENRIQNDMLLDLNKEYLRDMGITRMGDVIAILRHAKQVHESTARDRVLNTTAVNAKVPVAAVTGRATVTQPSSPASRILEHYTRNPQVKEASPVLVQQMKRKSSDLGGSNMETNNLKKARLIRFGTPPIKEAVSTKQTVFARLGNTEPVKSAVPVKTVTMNPIVKPIYARLGSKTATEEQIIPIPKDALKYEGILKSGTPEKKVVTITTTKNNVRKIAMGCTMRADETPLTVKEKLAMPKAKSVKFSNTVQYKEIEAVRKKVVGKPVVVNAGNKVNAFTQVFNKPERRLSMPEGANVKERLGTKSSNNLTITRNVFNRLGV